MITQEQIDYTPAPWTSEYCGKDRIAIFKISDKRRIATIAVKTPKMDKANANLIAAAPELLTACKAIMQAESTPKADVMEISTKAFARCYRAIAKAENN